jgi:hypothetical protein
MALMLDSHQWIAGDFLLHLTLSLFEASLSLSLSLSLSHFLKGILATWQIFFQKLKKPPKNDLKIFLGIFWK